MIFAARSARRSAFAVVLAVSLAFVGFDNAGAAKKPTSCTILKATQIAKVLGEPVTGPNEAGTLGIACDFDIGEGLGEPGGGIAIVSYYDKGLAKGVFASIKSAGEKVAGTKAWWDATAESAMVHKKGKLVGVSLTYTSSTPSTAELQPKMAALALLAAKKL